MNIHSGSSQKRFNFAVTRFVPFKNQGALKAFCDIAVEDLLLIKGVRIVEGKRGPFVSMPRQLSRNGKWYDSVVPLSKETRVRLIELVLETYKARESCGE